MFRGKRDIIRRTGSGSTNAAGFGEGMRGIVSKSLLCARGGSHEVAWREKAARNATSKKKEGKNDSEKSQNPVG